MEAAGTVPQVIVTLSPQGLVGLQQGQTSPRSEAGEVAPPQGVQTIRDTFSLSGSRLVIERDPDSARWVYKTIDSRTGELLSQFPIKSPSDLNLDRGMGLGHYYDARV